MTQFVIFRLSAVELDFSENEIGVLSAVNGRGKTTILSYIVDSFYEMARLSFPIEFEGEENKLYRLSSSLYNLQLIELKCALYVGQEFR